MANSISELFETLRDFGWRTTSKRIWDYGMFKIHRLTHGYDKENIKRVHDLRDKYKGKRIFLLGAGPSVNHQALYLLKNEYVMAFNRFFLMEERVNWQPELYAVSDTIVIEDIADKINSDIVKKVKYCFFPDRHVTNIDYQKYIKKRKNVYWLYVDKPEFSDNLPFCGINKTVVNLGIQVAAYMGFSEIYLLGIDLTYDDDKVKKVNGNDWVVKENGHNHFDPRYISKGKAYHNPRVGAMIEKFEECSAFYADKQVKIFNAGFGGRLEAFPRVDFESVLHLSEEQKKDYFMGVLKSIRKNIELTDFVNQPEGDKDKSFVVEENKGVNMIKDYVFTHVPVGPYNNSYYFVKREKSIE